LSEAQYLATFKLFSLFKDKKSPADKSCFTNIFLEINKLLSYFFGLKVQIN